MIDPDPPEHWYDRERDLADDNVAYIHGTETGNTATADKLRAALVDSAGLDDIPEPDPLITGLLYRNSLAWVVGKSGHGKSFVALDMAGCIGTGEPWQDHGTQQGTVLYVVAEGVTGIKQRVRAWEQSYGRQMTGVTWLPAAVQAGVHEAWNALITVAAEVKPTMVVIDTQARVTVGMEENAARDMGMFVDQLERLRAATQACVYVVHHQGRAGDHMRGSTALDGAADTVLQVTKEDDLVTIKNTKQKNAEEHEGLALRLSQVGQSAALVLADEKGSGNRDAAHRTAVKWWELFERDWVSVSKLIDAELVSKATFYRHARVLLDAGIAEKEERGRSTYYRLTLNPTAETDSVSGGSVTPPNTGGVRHETTVHETGRESHETQGNADPGPLCSGCSAPLLHARSRERGMCEKCRLEADSWKEPA
jgi:DNA-binding transcriptional ArsR family regulator